LEHRERIGTSVGGEGNYARWKDSHVLLVRAGVHVDHACAQVGVDREVALAEAVDYLRLAVLVLELAGEVGCPEGQVLNTREEVEHLRSGCVEYRGDGVAEHQGPP